MGYRWRCVVMTAAVVMGPAGLASAQTVYLRNAPAGTNVEVIVNAAPAAGTGTVDAEGEAKVPFKLPDGKTEMDSNILVDTCDKLRKVLIVDHQRQPPPPAEGCDRREIAGIYWVRAVNTVVVDVAGPTPALLLVRGSYTPPKPAAEGSEEGQPARPVPKGFLMFAGGAYTSLRDAGLFACGNVSPCPGHTSGFTYAFGASMWLTRFLGVEGAYIRPHEVKASGGDTFHFDTTLDTDVWTVAGKLGVQAGPVRVYGKGGFNYHEAVNKTTQTIDNLTQTFEYKTTGWSWLVGGGMEAWLGTNQRMAIYADASLIPLKGNAESGGEAKIDDRLRAVTVGVKLRISR